MSIIICEGEGIFLIGMTGLSLRCSMKFGGYYILSCYGI